MSKKLTISDVFLDEIRQDLLRAIPSDVDAYERAGFLFFTGGEGGLLKPSFYLPIPDSGYCKRPPGYGAYYGGEILQNVTLRIIETGESVFPIHIHPGRGIPSPSHPDIESEKTMLPSFCRATDAQHGAIILSEDDLLVRSWCRVTQEMKEFNDFEVTKGVSNE